MDGEVVPVVRIMGVERSVQAPEIALDVAGLDSGYRFAARLSAKVHHADQLPDEIL